MTAGLTRRQSEILGFIESEIARRGIPPTVREIAARFSMSSPNAVKCHLDALRDKGFLSVEPGVSRGIRPTRGERGAGYPLVGEVAAGGPVLAVQAEGESMTLDEASGARPGDFLLTVKGESMTGAGINPGDTAVVRPGVEVTNGEIAVVVLGGEEATLKRIFRGPGGVLRLVPENPEYAETVVDPAVTDLEILGRVVGLVRRY